MDGEWGGFGQDSIDWALLNIKISDFYCQPQVKLVSAVRPSLCIRTYSMSIRNFIGASSALLLAWLGATYIHEVPTERYPKQDRLSSLPSAINGMVSDGKIITASSSEAENR